MFEPFEATSFHPDFRMRGEERLAKGEVASLLLAGGQGTRLGSRYSSKGLFPISPLKQKSLFEVFAGKVRAASQRYGRLLEMAIMTSPLNHQDIVAHFENHHYFGLHPTQIAFFPQAMLPFLDEKGEALDACGPAGNGVALQGLFTAGIADSWQKKGVQCFTTILVDNPLADPFLIDLVGFHEGRDLSALVTKRRDLAEKVGLFVRDNGKVRVCEYMEFPEEEWPHHHVANLSQFCFSLDFAARSKEAHLPLHKVKKGSYYKCEYFIIDFVPLAGAFGALSAERSHCFAPLKNSAGDDSIVSVQKALQNRDRLRWQELFSIDPGNISFELSPEFYYPQLELLAHFKGQRPEENGYIEQ